VDLDQACKAIDNDVRRLDSESIGARKVNPYGNGMVFVLESHIHMDYSVVMSYWRHLAS
jgi:hypothetical protein